MPEISPEEADRHVERAKLALAEGDLEGGVFHAGCALTVDPTNADWLSLLDEAIARAPDPMELLGEYDEKTDFVRAAARAYALSSHNRFEEAFDLVARLATERPEVPFLLWAQEWMRRPGVASALSVHFIAGTLVPRLLEMTAMVLPVVAKTDSRRKNVIATHDVLVVLRHYFPEEPLYYFAGSVVARRLGIFADAMELAHKAFELRADWNSAVGVALACRDAGRVDDAVPWFRHALSLDPNEPSPLLDIGDAYLEEDRWEEAIAAYKEVLDKDSTHLWAEPSATYARWELKPDPALKHRLFELADHSPRAWELFCRIQKPEPYVHELPGPGDATANALRSIFPKMRAERAEADGGSVSLAVGYPESPSVTLAFELFTRASEIRSSLDVHFDRVQDPNPRVAKGHVDFQLWTWKGRAPHPNVPAPDAITLEAVASLARRRYNLELWAPEAERLASRIGVDGAPGLLGVMVHPPPLPDLETDALAWVQRVQIAAALIIAHVDTGWTDSVRKRTLYSLALGPSDWTVDAAIIAMAWVARSDSEARRDIEAFFAWLELQIPKEGHTSWELPLVCAWRALPGLESEVSAWLEKRQAEILARGAGTPASDESESDDALTERPPPLDTSNEADAPS